MRWMRLLSLLLNAFDKFQKWVFFFSKQENVKEVKMKITELNETFGVKVVDTDNDSIRNFPSYIELNSATSVATYNSHKSAISQHLKNKPKYTCILNDKNKLQMILNYFTNKEIISLNMDYIENNRVLLSFILSPFKDSVFFEDISHNSDCHFSISLTAPITDDIAISLFFCKYRSYIIYTIYNLIYVRYVCIRRGNESWCSTGRSCYGTGGS